MISNFYVDAIIRSRNLQLSRAIAGNVVNNGIHVLETSLDMGRQSGKTKAAFDYIKKSKGCLNIYVGHKIASAKCAMIENGVAESESVMILSKRQDFSDIFRGRRIEYQAINVILDECDLSQNDRFELVRTLMICMGKCLHPFPYIHLIRLGM